MENSRLTQTRAITRIALVIVGSIPGVPNSCGSTAVQPMPATRRPNSATFGVMPGISLMTTTAGPLPVR
jgi:hypothetical protein